MYSLLSWNSSRIWLCHTSAHSLTSSTLLHITSPHCLLYTLPIQITTYTTPLPFRPHPLSSATINKDKEQDRIYLYPHTSLHNLTSHPTPHPTPHDYTHSSTTHPTPHKHPHSSTPHNHPHSSTIHTTTQLTPHNYTHSFTSFPTPIHTLLYINTQTTPLHTPLHINTHTPSSLYACPLQVMEQDQ